VGDKKMCKKNVKANNSLKPELRPKGLWAELVGGGARAVGVREKWAWQGRVAVSCY